MELDIPENGYDSLLLRFWFTYPEGLYQYGEMLEIKFPANDAPQATLSRMRVFFNPTREYENINSHQDTIISSPKNGWDNFSNMIYRVDLKSIPTMENIPLYKERTGGYDFDNDLLTVSCEIATKDTYRFIDYNNFDKYKDIFQVGQMYEFIRNLRDEFYMHNIDDGWYGKENTVVE